MSSVGRVSVALQQEIHNPTKVIGRIKEFKWTMAKLVIVFDDTQSKEGNHLTNYLKLISDLTISENCKKCYQGVQLKHFTRANIQE